MHIKRGIRIGLAALFITLGIILVSSCGGGFTVTFVDTLRPPAKEPVKKKPPAPVEKEKPPEPAQEPEIKVEEPKTEVVASEEETVVVADEKQSENQQEKNQLAEEGSTETAPQEPTVTEKPEQRTEQPAPVEKKPKQKKEESAPVQKKPSVEKGKEQKVAKETEKITTGEKKKTKPPKTKKKESQKNAVSITGIVRLEKNTFYITEPESKKRYKLVGLKKEEEAILKKLIGKQAEFELRIVSTEAKKADNAQLVKILKEVPQVKSETEEPAPKKKKK